MSGMRKLLLLINSDATMSTSADLAKKASQNRPVYRNNPRDFSPRKGSQKRSEPRLDGPFQRTLHQFAFHGLFKTTLATINVVFFFIHLHVKAANSLFLFRVEKRKKAVWLWCTSHYYWKACLCNQPNDGFLILSFQAGLRIP